MQFVFESLKVKSCCAEWSSSVLWLLALLCCYCIRDPCTVHVCLFVANKIVICRNVHKLECLGALCGALLHPHVQLIEEKFGLKIFLRTQDRMKHLEMHKKVKVGKFFWR